MVSVHDVASRILKNKGPMTAWKLQKLVYYCQAWSLVWDERPMFREHIEAWANGPVCPELYNKHRGQFTVSEISGGNPEALDDDAKKTMDAVLSYYGDKPSQWISDLTHMEAPWREARGNLSPGERSNEEITHEAMSFFYESLSPDT